MKNSNKSCRLLLALLFCLSLLQGCTLLFIENNGTRYLDQKPGEPAKPAASLAGKMSAPVLLKYTVQDGDTLKSIAALYYGRASKAAKIASANYLNSNSLLEEGTVLRIPDPVNFPNQKDLARKKKEKITVKKSGGENEDIGPVNHIDITPENITKIPRPKANHSFAPGEKLKYEVKALSMVGGYGTLEVGEPVKVKDRSCYPLIVRAATAFPFSALYQVHEVQTSYFDTVDFVPWKFANDVLEGKYQAQNLETYDQVRHTAVRVINGKSPEEMDVAPFTQDIISCFYYFRLLPMKVGENYSIPTQSAGKNYNLIVEVIKKETVTIPGGTYDCLLVKPHVRYATVFRNTDDINIWLTDDDRHMPVLIKSKIFIGYVEATLMDATLPQMKKGDSTRKP